MYKIIKLMSRKYFDTKGNVVRIKKEENNIWNYKYNLLN